MRQERHVQLLEFPVERNEPRIGGIDVLNRGKPFHQHGSVPGGFLEAFNGVTPVRVDARSKEEIRIFPDLLCEKIVGDVYFGLLQIQLAVIADNPVHCQHHCRRHGA